MNFQSSEISSVPNPLAGLLAVPILDRFGYILIFPDAHGSVPDNFEAGSQSIATFSLPLRMPVS